MGRFGEAEVLYKRALLLSARILGTEHPDTVLCVGNLAALYQDQGRYGESEPLSKRALAGNEHIYGPDHPGTLTSVNNLGHVSQAQGPDGSLCVARTVIAYLLQHRSDKHRERGMLASGFSSSCSERDSGGAER
jgi:hypothetical protein